MLKNTLNRVFFYTVLVLILSSCKTTVQKPVNKIKLTAFDAYTKSCNKKSLTPYQVSYSLSITTNELNKKISGLIKIDTTGNLWMNGVSKSMGIEIFRILVKEDSLFFTNRLKKEFYAGDNKLLHKYLGFHLGLNDLNKIFSGGIVNFASENDSIIYKYFIVKDEVDSYEYLFSTGTLPSKEYDNIRFPQIRELFTLDKYGKLLTSEYVYEGRGKSLNLQYSYNSVFLDRPEYFNISTSSLKESLKLDFKFYNYKDLDSFTFRYKVPENYLQLNDD